LIFERANLDIVVIEVGMGGRLDATNIIPDHSVVLSALTAVDFDHQAFLGNSIHAITTEKASIARKGRPFVLGRQSYAEVKDVVRSVLDAVGAEFIPPLPVITRTWHVDIDGPNPPQLSLDPLNFHPPPPVPVKISMPCFLEDVNARLPLHGAHQLDNLGLATSIISTLLTHPSCEHLGLQTRLTAQSVARGIEAVKWPGRLSFHTLHLRPNPAFGGGNLTVLADGAHNPASSRTLAAYITHICSLLKPDPLTGAREISLTYILALSHSPPKTPLQTLEPLLPPVCPDHLNVKVNVGVALVRFSQPEGMPWVRCVPPLEMRDVVKSIASEADVWLDENEIGTKNELVRSLEWASRRSRGKEWPSLVVVAGSLYLVADFYRILQL